uniref:Peptidase_M14 domain-containing protein n=2 Tax=Bursaphelenchus xylophilus TaxID=6326 RepID=A0A1I7S1U6_BURXY
MSSTKACFIVFLLFILSIKTSTTPIRYDGAKIYQFDCPKQLLEVLKRKMKTSPTTRSFEIWSLRPGNSMNAIAFVAPEQQRRFERLLKKSRLNYSILNRNIQAAHDAEKAEMTRRRRKLMSTEKGTISVDQYHTLEEMEKYLKEVAELFPERIQLFEASKTYQGRKIYALKISNCIKCPSTKPSALVNAGFHAREWMSHASAIYIINEFVHNSKDPKIKWLLDRFDWYFVPNANPDGYVYTMNEDRLWRKTMSKHKGGVGVDMNRNYGYHWGEEKEAKDPAEEVFAGTGPLSEVETKGLAKFVDENVKNLTIFFDIHAFMQSFLLPWGYTKEKPKHFGYLMDGCTRILEAIKKFNGNKYNCGTPVELLYPVSGSAMDYYHSKGVPLSYSVEVRPFSKDNEMSDKEFLASMSAPASMIVPTGQEMLVSLYELGQYYYSPKQ